MNFKQRRQWQSERSWRWLAALGLQPAMRCLDLFQVLARRVARLATRWLATAAGVLWMLAQWIGPAWAGSYTFTGVVDNTGAFGNFYGHCTSINNAGVVAFRADLQSGVSGIYRSDGFTTVTIVDTSTGEFSFFAHGLSLESRPDIDDDGTVAFFVYDYGAPSIRTGAGGATTVIAESTSTGPFYDAFSNPSIRGGVVSFRGGLNSSGYPHGVFTEPSGGGGFSTLAQNSGMFAAYCEFGETSVNAGGQVAYCADLTNGTSGIFAGVDAATTLAQTGGDSQFSSLDSTYPKISDSGAIVFWADLTNLSSGLFASSGGVAQQITVAGGGQTASTFPSINAAGTVACYGSLPSGQSAVLAGTSPVVDKVIAEGDALFGSTVILLGEPGNNGLNNNGQIVFTYSLANGVEGIAIATPASAPPPASPELQIQMPDPLHVRLAWSTNAAGFSLVSAPSLPASAWNSVTNAPVVDGEQNAVVLELGSAPQFFQLSQ